MSVTDQLLENSKSYAESFDKGDLPLPPAKKVAVVACMDARLIPTRVLGLEEGDAHVIRNAGGVIAEDEIRSLSISQHLLGTEEIILIHHTDCGMLTFTDEEFKAQLREATGQEPDWERRGVHRPRRERAGVDAPHQGQPVHPAQERCAGSSTTSRTGACARCADRALGQATGSCGAAFASARRRMDRSRWTSAPSVRASSSAFVCVMPARCLRHADDDQGEQTDDGDDAQ